ncbi:MAG: hypothetical protein K2H51_02710, partial [Malacoplasma sp.]|nr:hypothetical protein [Malacoplasma sp.]
FCIRDSNSSDQLIVTSGDNVADINKSTKIMTFDEADAGFANVENKGNDEETNNFNYDQTKNTQNLSANDMLIGFLPSETSGINYSFWLQSNVQINSNGTELSYSTSNATTGAPNNTINSNNKWLNYYVIPVNDSFENITAPGTINRSTKTGNAYDAKRGYLLPASDNNLPKINDITKRFFSTGLSNNNGTTTETFGVLIDSYDSMFSTFINYSVNITDSNKSITLDQTPSFYFNVNNVNSGPTSDDLVSLPDNVAVNKWEFSSVGYDKESNFVYLSLSGSEINVSENNNDTIIPGKYLTNTRYASLKTADSNVSKDAYVESSPYTLSDVNFDTYTNQENLYLTKQVISGNDGQWLKTTVTDFNDDTKDFEPTTDSKINFYSLENLAKNLENSTILNNVMPSSINSTSLDGYLK